MGILDRLIRPSTRAFLNQARRVPGHGFLDVLHGYVYARWPYTYIGIGLGRHPLSKPFARVSGWFNRLATRRKPQDGSEIGFADTYHGKAVPLETAQKLVLINEDIQVHDLEQVIPYKRARSLIMENPGRIVALDCPCRAAREHPCLPLDVCLIIGEPFASFILDHQPDRSRLIPREEALAILQAEDERGHVHHAFFKDAMLERFYAICNCCECCCGAMQAQRNGVPMLCSSGYVTQVDSDLCMGCGDCVPFCQFGALQVEDDLNVVEWEKCMGCGVCIGKCDHDALTLVRDEAKGVPLEISAQMARVLPV